MTLGQKLRLLRKEKGISQEKLAEQLGVSRQAVSKWELDITLPETENIIKIGNIFDVSYDYLLRENMEERTCFPGKKQSEEKTNGYADSIILFVKKYGYFGGYALSAVSAYCLVGYAIALAAVMGMTNFTGEISGMSAVISTGPLAGAGAIKAMLVFYIVLSLLGIAGGLFLAGWLKKKTEKYRKGGIV